MGRIYRLVDPDEPLAQGDIFCQIPCPILNFRAGVHLEHQQDGIHREAEVEDGIVDGMRFLAEVELVDAIVLEQSCDTLRGRQVTLAPLAVLDLTKRKNAKDKWESIKRIGQTLSEPSRLYLTSDVELGFPRRSVDLSAKFNLSPEDLTHFAQLGKRVATLRDKALVNLQHRLTVQMSRIARDDIDWLSEEDMEVKIEALAADADKSKNSLETKKCMLAKTPPGEKRDELAGDVEVAEENLGHLLAEIEVAERALATVRKEGQAPKAALFANGVDAVSGAESFSQRAS